MRFVGCWRNMRDLASRDIIMFELGEQWPGSLKMAISKTSCWLSCPTTYELPLNVTKIYLNSQITNWLLWLNHLKHFTLATHEYSQAIILANIVDTKKKLLLWPQIIITHIKKTWNSLGSPSSLETYRQKTIQHLNSMHVSAVGKSNYWICNLTLVVTTLGRP